VKLTFLGHQGWLIQAGDYRLLIDPILAPWFRNSAHSRVWVHPPRRIDLAALGRVDGVYFSHEHEDHFHIASIDALPRTTRMFLSGNMSGAAEDVLVDMGFGIERLYAGDQLTLGTELELSLFAPPAAPSERCVLQPFVRGASLQDSFFNLVDCGASPDFLEFARKQKLERLGLVCVANNQQAVASSTRPNALRPGPATLGDLLEPSAALSAHLGLRALPPARFLAIVGGGFYEETSPYGLYLNPSQKKLGEVIAAYVRAECRVFGPDPGEQVDLTEAAPGQPLPRADFVVDSSEANAAIARALAVTPPSDPGRYDPVTRTRSLGAEQRQRLDEALQSLAVRIASHAMHKEMTQQAYAKDERGNRIGYGQGRLLLRLLHEPDALVYEYVPSRARFTSLPREPQRPVDVYPFGFECWASDLLALCCGELSVYELIKHRFRSWEPTQTYLGRFNVPGLLDDLFAPDVVPDLTYRLYSQALERCRSGDG
jgi:hypothetical protein